MPTRRTPTRRRREVGLNDQGAAELAADRRRDTTEEQVADAAAPGFSIK